MSEYNRFPKESLDRWLTREPESSLECEMCELQDECDGDVCLKKEPKNTLSNHTQELTHNDRQKD